MANLQTRYAIGPRGLEQVSPYESVYMSYQPGIENFGRYHRLSIA
jgi:hypothetical protein